MRLIIAGSRDFEDYKILKAKCDAILANVNESIEVISGTCRGADRMGEYYAKQKG